MKTKEIAAAIDAHLKRFEADPVINGDNNSTRLDAALRAILDQVPTTIPTGEQLWKDL